MVDISKQVEFWRKGAEEDWAVAVDLVDRGNPRHGLFFLHLSLEKALKAHVCRTTGDLAPRIHNLVRLAEMANLPLDSRQVDVLAEANVFGIEGRYPDESVFPSEGSDPGAAVERVREVFRWLMDKS